MSSSGSSGGRAPEETTEQLVSEALALDRESSVIARPHRSAAKHYLVIVPPFRARPIFANDSPNIFSKAAL